jgi:hypothetical protein
MITDIRVLRAWAHELRRKQPPNWEALYHMIGERAASLGDTKAMNWLSVALLQGRKKVRDVPRAIEIMRKAWQSGSGLAAHNLGTYYAMRGGRNGKAKAVRYYRAAADCGFREGMITLGSCLYYGTGIRRNFVESLRWWRLAARRGSPEGAYLCGRAALVGEGRLLNRRDAMKWFERGARTGHRESQRMLAVLRAKTAIEGDVPTSWARRTNGRKPSVGR